jgi:acyl-CoA thioesterase I
VSLDNSKVIVFQGDSITDCGRSREEKRANFGLGSGYAMLAAAKLLAASPQSGLQIYNKGIGGNRVVDLYARWKTDCLNLKPDVLSILIGVNDTWHEYIGEQPNGIDVDRYEKIYRDILEWTLEVNKEIKLILCQPFILDTGVVTDNWFDEIKRRGEIVRKLADEYNGCYVPFQSLFDKALERADAAYWLSDGVRPTCAGHKLMCDMWLEKVREKG